MKAIVCTKYGSPDVLQFKEVEKPTPRDLDMLRSIGADRVIDRHYPLSEVAEALRYLEEGHAKGKVVITLQHNNNTAYHRR